jgi:hypothetical protein
MSRARAAWIATLALLAPLGMVPACKRATTPSPEKLREAQLSAMKADDPSAAYALLSPEVQARVPKAEFIARWKDMKAERAAIVRAAEAMPEAEATAAREGTTVHDGGRVLSWTLVGDRYLVVEGLPGRPRTATPAEAIRSFLAAARATDLSRVRALFGEELATSLQEDFGARVDAIERALEDPGAIELSSDEQRAELRYEPDRAVRLVQTDAGWRITALE